MDESENMLSGDATIDLVECVDDVENGDRVVEFNALGSRDLVWVATNVTMFIRSGSGFSVRVKSNGSQRWIHESNVRNFIRHDR